MCQARAKLSKILKRNLKPLNKCGQQLLCHHWRRDDAGINTIKKFWLLYSEKRNILMYMSQNLEAVLKSVLDLAIEQYSFIMLGHYQKFYIAECRIPFIQES